MPLTTTRRIIAGFLFAILVFGPSIFCGILAVIAARHFGLSFPITVLVTSCTFILAAMPLWIYESYDSKRILKKVRKEEDEDRSALSRWQSRHRDPVLGTPYFETKRQRGWFRAHLDDYSGVVSIPMKGGTLFKVYITPAGFTDAQRRFYLRVNDDLPIVMKEIYGPVATGFQNEFPNAEDFPHDPFLKSVTIGEEKSGVLTDTVLSFEYAQDEYVDVNITGNHVTSVYFYM